MTLEINRMFTLPMWAEADMEMQPYSFIKFAFTLLTKHYRAPIQTALMMAGPLWPIAVSAKKGKSNLAQNERSNYLWVADNNWINFAEKWMCFDALVADWQSAGFSPVYHSPFICRCQTFPRPPFQCRLIKQLFNKTKRHLHGRRTEQGFTAQGGESWDEYQLTLRHAAFSAMRSLTQYRGDWLLSDQWGELTAFTRRRHHLHLDGLHFSFFISCSWIPTFTSLS